ncbi:MAG TPA: transaldolase [Acidimicrobiia bacterium]|nr:transaldolase [Acidimicrobiia bacterium]
MTTSRINGLADAGVSVWSDQISRAMLDSGELALRIERDAVTGVTSNPTIFAGAIVGSSDYDEQLQDLKSAGVPTEEIAKSLMTADIQRGCDLLLEVFHETAGGDGFVSVEVSPTLAGDSQATVSEARDWVKRISRPNLLVKVPATPEGVAAIRALTGEGISVNVTLIFSLDRYAQVIEAYLSGLEDFHSAGGDLSTVASVASFFVSRFDTEVDPRLEALGTEAGLAMRGVTAIANARVAYGLFQDWFESERFRSLAPAGASVQRPLWASTSTKSPAYPDLLYVEGLVAPATVNTMPLDTIDAYQDHGDPSPAPFTEADIKKARQDLDRLGAVGIDYEDVVRVLEEEGVEKFTRSWLELLERVEQA